MGLWKSEFRSPPCVRPGWENGMLGAPSGLRAPNGDLAVSGRGHADLSLFLPPPKKNLNLTNMVFFIFQRIVCLKPTSTRAQRQPPHLKPTFPALCPILEPPTIHLASPSSAWRPPHTNLQVAVAESSGGHTRSGR